MEEFILYSIEEVTKILKVTQRTLYNYIKNGDLKAVKVGKYWRVKQEDLREFINKDTEEQNSNQNSSNVSYGN